MATRNITLRLPSDLIRKAQARAAQCNSTVSALVRKLLEDALPDDRRTRDAADQLLAIAERGPYFERDPRSIRREETHERGYG